MWVEQSLDFSPSPFQVLISSVLTHDAFDSTKNLMNGLCRLFFQSYYLGTSFFEKKPMISFSFPPLPPTVWVLRKRKKREENSYLGLLAFTEARKVLGFCSQDPETALLVLNPNITFLAFLVKEKNKKNEKSSSPNVTTNHLTPEFLSYLFVSCFLCFLSNHTTRKPLC